MMSRKTRFALLALLAGAHGILCSTVGPYAALTLGPLIFLLDGVAQIFTYSAENNVEGYLGRLASWFGWALGAEIAAILFIGVWVVLRKETRERQRHQQER
jgi:hypothetical protein